MRQEAYEDQVPALAQARCMSKQKWYNPQLERALVRAHYEAKATSRSHDDAGKQFDQSGLTV
jgi:hypothetical protein